MLFIAIKQMFTSFQIAAAENTPAEQKDLKPLHQRSPPEMVATNSSIAISSIPSHILPYLEPSPPRKKERYFKHHQAHLNHLKSPPRLTSCPSSFSLQPQSFGSLYGLNPIDSVYKAAPSLPPLPPLSPPPPVKPAKQSFFPPLPSEPLMPLSPPSPNFTPLKRKISAENLPGSSTTSPIVVKTKHAQYSTTI